MASSMILAFLRHSLTMPSVVLAISTMHCWICAWIRASRFQLWKSLMNGHMNVWSRFCTAMAKKSLPSRSRGQSNDSANRLRSRPRLNWLKSLKMQSQRQLGGTADIRPKRAFKRFALRSMMSWAPWRTHWSRRLRCLTLVAASV